MNKYLNMGFIEQPGSFFGGGFTITGDVKIEGDIRQNPVRFGLNAESLEDTIAIGQNSEATGDKSQAIGRNAKATRQSSLSLGPESNALGIDATALGVETTAPTNWNTVVGYDAGSFDNGENIVLIGRKSQAQGDDSVAIGESSRANGLQSTSIGKAASALGKNSSIFGQAGTVTGDNSTVMGQGASIDNDRVTTLGTSVNVSADDAVAMGTDATVSGKNASAIGKNATAAAQGSTAVGKNTTVTGENSLALGAGTTVTLPNTFTFGDRNISLPIGRSFVYPPNPGNQSIVNIPITEDATQGSIQAYSFDIGGESVFQVEGIADGAGGVTDKRATILTGFEIKGASDAAPDIITGDISFRDQDGDEKLIIDTSTDPPRIDFLDNGVTNFGLRPGESVTFPENSGSESLANIPVSNASANSEQSYTLSVGGTDVAKIFSLASSSGGIKAPEFRTLETLNLNSNDLKDSDTVLYDTSQGHIKQSVLENDSLSYKSGDGLIGGGEISLGNEVTINVSGGNFITANSSDIEVNIGSGIEGDGADNIRVKGDAISNNFLSEGTDPHQVSVNLGTGLEGDGLNNIRVSASDVAGNVLSEGSDPFEIDLNIGNGVRKSGNNLSVQASEFISVEQSGISVNTGRGIEGDGADNIQINENQTFNFVNEITFQSGITTTGNIQDSGNIIYDSSNKHIEQSILENDTITLNTSNGLSAGSVSLGNSLDIGISGTLTLDTSLETSSGNLIWDNANNYIPQSRLENDTITFSAGDGILSAGSVSLGNSNTITVDPSQFISVGSNGISVNISRGLTGDSSDNIQVDESVGFDFTSEITFSSGLDVGGDIRDGTLTIYSFADNQINQGALQNDSVGVITGNGLEGGNNSLSLGSSLTLSISKNAIQLNELDESISPTFTGTHTFSGGITMDSTLDIGQNDVINVPIPDAPQKIANKSYVDGVAAGLTIKASSAAATDGKNVNLSSTTDPNPIDGFNLSDGQRVLLKDQNDATQNGIYTASTATDPSTWSRSADFDEDSEVESGAFTFIRNGDTNGSTSFTVITSNPIELGVDEINFAEFARAGQLSGGVGINLSNQIVSIDFASITGSGIEESGNELRIDSSAIGDGLTGGSGQSISVTPSNFAGSGLVDDGNNDLKLNTPFSSISTLFSTPVKVGAQLNLGGDLLGSAGTVTIYDSTSDHIPISAFEASQIQITGNDGISSGSVTLGSSVSIGISGTLSLQSDLESNGGNLIWDDSNSYIPQNRLENDSIQLSTGNGIQGGSTESLGGGYSISVKASDFAGGGITTDVNGSLELLNDSITFSAGDGLKNGETVSLGGTASLDINPSDFSGKFLNTTTSDNIEVQISTGLTSDANGNIIVDESTGFSFSSNIQFDGGLDVRQDIVDNGVIVYDSSNSYVPSSILEATDIQVSGQNGLSGGTASLGGSVTVGISGNLNLDSDLKSSSGRTIWDESEKYIPQKQLENDSVTINNSSVSLGSSISISLSDLSAFDISGNDLIDSTTTIYDSSNSNIPVGTLSSSQVTVSTSGGLQGGGSPSLGGSGIDISLVNDSIDINTSNGLTNSISGSTVSLGGSVDIGISGSLELDTDLKSNSTGTNEVIWDESNGYIRQEVLENTSITIGGNTVTLGGSTNVQIDDLSSFDLNGNNIFDSQGTLTLGGNVEIPTGTLDISDNKLFVGSSQDFSFSRDTDADEFVFRDETNNIDIFRQPKGGPTNFLQGIDAGPITAPEDSFSQIINEPVTSALASGSRVGYSFSLDNQNIIEIDGEADGSGGIQNTAVSVNRTLRIPNDNLKLQDGSLSDLSLSFDADSDTGLHRPTSGTIQFIGNGSPLFRLKDSGEVELKGNGPITRVGGATDASSGAIRLANGTSIKARNSGDTNDLQILRAKTDDTLKFGSAAVSAVRVDSNAGPFRLEGNNITQVGGTTDANSGVIRLANGFSIKARNSADSADVGLISSDINDNVVLGFNSANNIRFSGSAITELGGKTDASSGAIRLSSNKRIKGRNSANSGDISFIGTDSGNNLIIGDTNNNFPQTVIRGGSNGEIDFSGENLHRIGGTPAATTGAIRTTQDANTLVSRDSSDSNDIPLIGITGGDKIAIGNADATAIDLKNNVELSGDLFLQEGQTIKDGGGTKRIRLKDTQTRIFGSTGSFDNLIDIDGRDDEVTIGAKTSIVFEDRNGDFAAVQYDTDSTAGVLRTPGAGIAVQSDHGREDDALNIRWLSDSDIAALIANDSAGNNLSELDLKDGFIDMSPVPADLRIATGQAIEDGDGTNRIVVSSSGTQINDGDGNRAIKAYRSANGGGTRLRTKHGGPITIVDDVGGFEPVKYLTSASPPGVLKLTNAELNLDNNNIQNVDLLNLSTISSNNGFDPINVTQRFQMDDNVGITFGNNGASNNGDFGIEYDSSTDELRVFDRSNGVDLIRQPKAGPTQFLQGADVGPISAPEDSFTQIINAPVTSALPSGDTVGYTFAVDNIAGLQIQGNSDGSGGVNNVKVSVDNISDINQGFIDFEVSGTKRAQLDSNGDFKIEGELTEGATL